MLIEQGDFFIIERGFELHESNQISFIDDSYDGWMDNPTPSKTENRQGTKERYCRSYYDCVFVADDVQGDVILARIVGTNCEMKLNTTILIRQHEMVLMVVPYEWVKKMPYTKQVRRKK